MVSLKLLWVKDVVVQVHMQGWVCKFPHMELSVLV